MKKLAISVFLIIVTAGVVLVGLELNRQDQSTEDSAADTTSFGYDIIILAGEQNAYSGIGFEPFYDSDNSRIDQLDRNNETIPASASLRHITPTSSDNFVTISFVRTFAQMYRDSGYLQEGRRILILPQAEINSGFSNNRWNPGGDMYQDTVTRTNFAVNNVAGQNNRVVAFLWHQGETDSANGMSQSNYEQNFVNMIESFEQDINTFASSTPVIVGPLVPAWVGDNPNRITINNAHSNIPSLRSNTAFVNGSEPFEIGRDDEATLRFDNDLENYSSVSQRILGKRYFDKFSQLILNNGLATSLPQYCSHDYGTVLSSIFLVPNPNQPTNQSVLESYENAYLNTFSWGGVTDWQGQMWNVRQSRFEYDFTLMDGVVEFNEQNGKQTKYHSLMWHNYRAFDQEQGPGGDYEWYSSLSVQDKREALREHIETVMNRYQGRIEIYDVVNHAAVHGNDNNFMFTGWSRVEAVDQMLRWARETDPNATLLINEGLLFIDDDAFNRYVNLITQLQQRNSPLDGIGIMTHEGFDDGKIEDMEVYKSRLDTLASFGYPIHISEIDIGMPENTNFNPNQAFEGFNSWWDYQAWAYGELYDFLSNYPAVVSINTWGFYDGRHWREGAGYYFDGTYGQNRFQRKPAYFEIEDYTKQRGCNATLATNPIPVEEPFACPQVFEPVCGTNGQTYSNSCEAGTNQIECTGACPCSNPVEVVDDPEPIETIEEPPTVDPNSCPATDANDDGRISLTDLTSFAQIYGSNCQHVQINNSCGSMDSNRDNRISLADLAAFASQFGLFCQPIDQLN